MCAHSFAGERLRHAAAPRQAVVLAPGLLIAGIAYRSSRSRNRHQVEAANPDCGFARLFTSSRPTSTGLARPSSDNDLRRTQNPIVLALRESYPPLRRFRCGEHRLHAGARLIHEACHALAIGFQIGAAVGVATPLSMAALATAGAIRSMRRGSKVRRPSRRGINLLGGIGN